MEKRQKDGDAVFTDNNRNNNISIDETAITAAQTNETASVATAETVDAINTTSTHLNGDTTNNNNQQTTSDVIPY